MTEMTDEKLTTEKWALDVLTRLGKPEKLTEGYVQMWRSTATWIGLDVAARADGEGLTRGEWAQIMRDFTNREGNITIEAIAANARLEATGSEENPDHAYERASIHWAAVAQHGGRLTDAYEQGLTTKDWQYMNAAYEQSRGN